MCTLMEKDVLIESISGVLTMMRNKIPSAQRINDDQQALIRLRDHLYFTDADDIDFNQIKQQYSQVEQKYAAM